MADEKEMERLAAQMQLQQAKGEAIREQMARMEANVIDIRAAIEAVQNLRKAKGDVLVPLGAGVFISCPKPDADKVIINIGANVMVQKKPDEAVKILEDREKQIGNAITAAQEDLTEVVRAIDDLTQRASAIAAVEGKNVRPSKE